jgi:hypothetical protein
MPKLKFWIYAIPLALSSVIAGPGSTAWADYTASDCQRIAGWCYAEYDQLGYDSPVACWNDLGAPNCPNQGGGSGDGSHTWGNPYLDESDGCGSDYTTC